MYAEEMAREPVAEPESGLGLEECVLAEIAVVEFPRHIVARYVESPARSEPDFQAEVRRCEGIIGKIALYGKSLRAGTGRAEKCDSHRQYHYRPVYSKKPFHKQLHNTQLRVRSAQPNLTFAKIIIISE